jgi:small subunit ribosomal protein S4
MGRATGPKCRQCRREGEKLFLKGDRCYSQRCAINRRNTPPGERAKKLRPRRSQYLLHLREKQKVRRIYGVGERQFRNYVELSKRWKGVTGEALLQLLERRIDNLVYRAGFASSRAQARQLVLHGHFELNGRPMNMPSTLLKEGDTVAVKEGRRDRVKGILQTNEKREIPSWLERNLEAMKFQLVMLPQGEEIGYRVDTNLIVEYYSR